MAAVKIWGAKTVFMDSLGARMQICFITNYSKNPKPSDERAVKGGCKRSIAR